MRLADARLAASIMINCSISESFTDRPGCPAVGLDDEDVGAPDRLLEPGVDLAVGEVDQVGLGQLDAEVAGDVLGQGRVGPAGQQVELALGDQFHHVAPFVVAPGLRSMAR